MQRYLVPQRPKTRVAPIVVFAFIALLFGLVFGNLASGTGLFDLAGILRLPSISIPGGGLGNRDSTNLDEYTRRLTEVCRLLDDHALHSYSAEEVDVATGLAIEGLLEASGDIRAAYYDAQDYAAYQQDSSGEYVGIGVLLTLGIDGRVTVSKVYADSPALEHGVRPGDVLLAVDGERRDWDVTEAARAVRREAGSSVTIIWERDGKELSTTMAVRVVKRQIVATELFDYQGHKVGYIKLDQFTYDSDSELQAAVRELDEAGAECFILDLRDNPGGLLYAAVNIASVFLDEGVVVHIEGRDGSSSRRVVRSLHETDKPLVVLINGGSASASELVTAAFQDHGRATVVGEISYGKGTVQDLSELSFGGAIKYTIAHYLSPSQHTIDGIGVIPDTIVDDGYRLNDADIIHRLEAGEEIDLEAEGIDPDNMYDPNLLTGPYPGDPGYKYEAGIDIQLDKALEISVQGF
ncbi:MAG: S41 family peptidase [Coriobacteriia bacterium]|nr:S41 family peptidase [Coriobacteriia bacterium]